MKKLLTIILVIGAVVSTAYWYFYSDTTNQSEFKSVIETSESAAISNLSFSYRTSPKGLILISDHQNWPENVVSSLSLFSKRDYEWFSEPGFIGEYPPSITISVFQNPEHLTPQVWTETNSLISNIEFIEHPPTNTGIGGADGIHYVVLGLYFFDTYVLTYGDNIYLLSGAYHEESDEYYQNIKEVLSTVIFETDQPI